MVILVLALFGCAAKTAGPVAGTSAPVEIIDETEVVSAPVGPSATPVARMDELVALAPILVSRSVSACEPASVLCAKVSCHVENRMTSGFPSRWTLAVDGPQGTVRDNQRWIVAPQTAETRSVELPLASFMKATCRSGGSIEMSSRATACQAVVDCVDVVCSAWSNGPATTAYVDVNLTLTDGRSFDHNAVPVAIPAAGDVVQTVFRYRPGSQDWSAGQTMASTPLPLTGSCGYWQGDRLIEALPQ